MVGVVEARRDGQDAALLAPGKDSAQRLAKEPFLLLRRQSREALEDDQRKSHDDQDGDQGCCGVHVRPFRQSDCGGGCHPGEIRVSNRKAAFGEKFCACLAPRGPAASGAGFPARPSVQPERRTGMARFLTGRCRDPSISP